jgi:hypothetical protein
MWLVYVKPTLMVFFPLYRSITGPWACKSAIVSHAGCATRTGLRKRTFPLQPPASMARFVKLSQLACLIAMLTSV